MRVRTLCIIAALTWLIPIGGCGTTSAERVAVLEAAVTAMQARSGQVDAAIAALETFLADGAQLLAEPNLPAGDIERIAAAVVTASAKLESAQVVKGRVDAALSDLQAQLAAADAVTGPGAELQLIGSAVSTIGAHAPPPYGTYAALAGSLITAIGGVIVGLQKAAEAKQKTAALEGKTQEARELGCALGDVIAGGEAFKKAAFDKPTEAAVVLFKESQRKAQARSSATRELVAVARTKVTP